MSPRLPTLPVILVTGLALALGACSAQRPATATAPVRPTEPAQPVARVATADLAWGEGGVQWNAADSVDNLMQISYGQDGSDFDPDLSPDGRTMVYASTQHRLTADLYLKPVGGHAVTQLTNDPAHDLMPSFSPDGSRVAYASNRSGSWDIFVVSTSGGQAVQITTEGTHELHPTWSPDGSRLAFCRLSPTSGRWEIWEVELTNTAVSRFLGYGLLPEWNPKLDKIAFQRSRERGDRLYSIWTIDYVDGEPRNPTEIASSPDWAFINPSWSPEGEMLVFSAVRNPAAEIAGGLGPVPATADLWMVGMDGSHRIRLTGGEYADLMPDWGPDGRVYFVSNRAGLGNIWSLAPDRPIQTASFGAQGGSGSTNGIAGAKSDPSRGSTQPQAAATKPRATQAAKPTHERDQHKPTPLPPVADVPTHQMHGPESDPH